ncbi:hypothetical protein SIIN_5406_T [Serendipita indica DSM 11827]|nr:hypothetical protein SIIN_5406_T [Serendipita indica DSM 11827]
MHQNKEEEDFDAHMHFEGVMPSFNGLDLQAALQRRLYLLGQTYPAAMWLSREFVFLDALDPPRYRSRRSQFIRQRRGARRVPSLRRETAGAPPNSET